MEILITEMTTSENITGFNVTFINRTKKKMINDADFFPEGSEVEVKIKQLKRLLKQHFDAQA
jgi:hypothetical protein